MVSKLLTDITFVESLPMMREPTTLIPGKCTLPPDACNVTGAFSPFDASLAVDPSMFKWPAVSALTISPYKDKEPIFESDPDLICKSVLECNTKCLTSSIESIVVPDIDMPSPTLTCPPCVCIETCPPKLPSMETELPLN